MTMDLNLKVQHQDDGSIHVAWNDAIKGMPSKRSLWFAGVPILSLLAFALLETLFGSVIFDWMGRYVDTSLRVILISALLGVLWVVFSATAGSAVLNQVKISAVNFEHEGQLIPTPNITRFEYGNKQSFTGNPKHHGSIIRLWVDDTQAYTVSENNWESTINHELHATLTKALEAVRDAGKQQENAEEFGVVDAETGMPDY